MKTRFLLLHTILIIFIIAGIAYLGRHQISDVWDQWISEPVPDSISVTNFLDNQNSNENENTNAPTNEDIEIPEPEITIPDEFNLDVPFTTQSPFAEWTEQDDESCEEAAALIVHYYWQNKTFTKKIAKQELQTIVDFENEYFGFYKDTDAAETAEFIRELWGYERVDVVYDITLDDVKREVVQGRPIIIPSAGRMLGNPNFRTPGPLYHMLVVRGWTENTIITNDPGTRNGENYQYASDVLYEAIHDWNDGDVENGRKAMIVVWSNNE